MARPVRPDQTCINGKIWSMFLKYLAKMDLILNFPVRYRPRSEAQTFCVLFNSLIGLAVLIENAQSKIIN